MSAIEFCGEPKVELKANDPRLLRAAQRIIRLYDLTEEALYRVKPESMANIIAHELNQVLPTERNE